VVLYSLHLTNWLDPLSLPAYQFSHNPLYCWRVHDCQVQWKIELFLYFVQEKKKDLCQFVNEAKCSSLFLQLIIFFPVSVKIEKRSLFHLICRRFIDRGVSFLGFGVCVSCMLYFYNQTIPMGTARLTSVSSQDSGFTSQDTLFLRPATPTSLNIRRKVQSFTSCVKLHGFPTPNHCMQLADPSKSSHYKYS
jgi:hypothetical protein